MDTFNPGWFVIYTRPRHEKKISEQLLNQGISNFLPLVKALRSWSGRRKYVDVPLFPSYLFIQLQSSNDYFSSLDLHGVLYYVRDGKQVARLDENVIRKLRLVSLQPQEHVLITPDRIKPGTRMMITQGPFTGFCCDVVRYNGREKILVQIDVIQRNVLLDLPAKDLLSTDRVFYSTANTE